MTKECALRASGMIAGAVPEIHLSTDQTQEVIDITAEVAKEAAGFQDDLCSLFLPHTTAALAILTNEEGLATDYIMAVKTLVPALEYVHDSADHVKAHVLSSLVGPSVLVPVEGGRLQLGEFQRIVLVEFEGPRQRTIKVNPLPFARLELLPS